MQTAIIDVTFVKPPKDGKQYGSIKGANNDWWPVKADRLAEFKPDSRYEVGYTESETGFRSIASVKRIVPDAGPSMRGEFTQVDTRPRNGATLMARNDAPRQQQEPAYETPKASTQESIFVCGGLYRDIEANRVEATEDALVERAILWRNVYRRAFPE